MFKVDLHTHSTASPDGGLTAEQYEHALATNLLDVIAITDHNQIAFAQKLQARLGDRIIVGEEIMSTAGEIIGLFLSKRVAPGLSPHETIEKIKAQGGVVYVPHPFESVRAGLPEQVMDELADFIDVVEVCNGRAFRQNYTADAVTWARLNRICGAASSDAHGWHGFGRTYTALHDIPNHENLMKLLERSTPFTKRPTARALLYPRYHRLRRKLRRSK